MIRSEMISPTDLEASLHRRALNLERLPSSFLAIYVYIGDLFSKWYIME